MTPRHATFPAFPCYIVLLAPEGTHADHMARDWYERRFSRKLGTHEHHIDGVHAAWERDTPTIMALAEAGVRGAT